MASLLATIQQQGLFKTSRMVKRYLIERYVQHRDNLSFDNQYGIETSRIESDYINDAKSDYLHCAEFYEATNWRSFSAMLQAVPLEYSDYTFIDAGSGKGRVMMFASRYKFKKIIGVEFSEYLADTSKENLLKFIKKSKSDSDFDVQCTDIALFDLPNDNLFIYLYNPFSGELMELFIEKIRCLIETSGFQIIVLYKNPACAKMFEDKPFFESIVSNDVFSVFKSCREESTEAA